MVGGRTSKSGSWSRRRRADGLARRRKGIRWWVRISGLWRECLAGRGQSNRVEEA